MNLEKPNSPWGENGPDNATELDKAFLSTIEITFTQTRIFNELVGRSVRDRSTEMAIEYTARLLDIYLELLEDPNPSYRSSSNEPNGVAMTDWAEEVVEYARAVIETGNREESPSLVISCEWKSIKYSPWKKAASVVANAEGIVGLYKHSSGKIRIKTKGGEVNFHERDLVINNEDYQLLKERGFQGKLFDSAGKD